MTYNEETKLFEMTYKKITVNNDTKPEFKVVKQPMEGAAVWYPEGDNWVITPDVVGGEGIFDITITFDPSDLKEIKVSALQYADIEISPAEGDIAAALAEAWALTQYEKMSLLVGMRRPENLRDNLKCLELKLSADEIGQIEAAVRAIQVEVLDK